MKKVREFLHLRRLGELLRVLPASECQEAEGPDFIFDTPSGLLGIEVTEYHVDHRVTAREKARLDILRRAERVHKAANRPPLFVTVVWNSSADITKAMRSALPGALADLVHSNTPSTGSTIKLRSSDSTNASLLGAIDCIAICRYAEEPNDLWYSPSGGDQRQMSPSDLQMTLDSKNALLPKYRQRAPTTWLLIVCGRTLEPTLPEITSGVTRHRFESGFDRVFLLSYLTGRAYELVVGTSATQSA